MPIPQSGVLPEAKSNALFVLFRRRIGRQANGELKKLLSKLPKRIAKLAASDAEAHSCAVIAFGSEIWGELWPDRPKGLRPFPQIAGAVHAVPVTEADIFLHLRGERYDLLNEFADHLIADLSHWFDLLEAVHGFQYHGGRDLTGFVDGTANPEGKERAEVALVGDEDTPWAGGSYVHVQRYIHRLEAWGKLPVKQQEAIIGRTKQDNIEFPEDERPLTSHLHRVNIEEKGLELELLRHSMPYGSPGGERGLLFCAYCRSPDNFEKMLTRMVSPNQDGRIDHLLNFTRAVTGAAFFAPSEEKLQALSHP